MADIEKILEAAEYCLTNGKCTECKFSNGRMFATCRYLMEDALALLKEQQEENERIRRIAKEISAVAIKSTNTMTV